MSTRARACVMCVAIAERRAQTLAPGRTTDSTGRKKLEGNRYHSLPTQTFKPGPAEADKDAAVSPSLPGRNGKRCAFAAIEGISTRER